MLENAMKIADLKTVVRDSTFLKAPPRFDASALLLKEAEVEIDWDVGIEFGCQGRIWMTGSN